MKRTIETKFYLFSQNNSGGSFYENEEAGVAEYVIVEARDADEANDRFFNEIGDKCDYGFLSSCGCCGERWSHVDEYDGSEKPSIYGNTDLKGSLSRSFFEKSIYIHYYDGTIECVEKD